MTIKKVVLITASLIMAGFLALLWLFSNYDWSDFNIDDDDHIARDPNYYRRPPNW